MNALASRPWLSSCADGVPKDVPPATETLVDMVAASVQKYGSNVALEFFGATTSYSELDERIIQAANGLRLLGVIPGDRVALVLPNCPQHVIAFHEVLRLGAIVVGCRTSGSTQVVQKVARFMRATPSSISSSLTNW